MKTLEEHNKERWDQHALTLQAMQPHANGIACPQCGAELWDSDPCLMLASNPPQKNVHCPSCGYKGYRFA